MTATSRNFPLALSALAVLLSVLAVALYQLDRWSLERGNRFYRHGEVSAAADVYRAIGAERNQNGSGAYNLGTALLVLEVGEAERHLRVATEGSGEAAQRAHYNLGFLILSRIEPSLAQDSAVALLEGAVAHTRLALRLDPTHENARWNLALAQRMLDSLTHLRPLDERRLRAGLDETRIADDALVRSGLGIGESGEEPESPGSSENLAERQGAADGAREAWASYDPGAMSREQASRLVADVEDDAEQLVRGILWSQRPDVAIWFGEPYPGGNW